MSKHVHVITKCCTYGVSHILK